MKSVAWTRKNISAFDAVLIATAHLVMDYRQLADWAPLIVDTRNVMAKYKPPSGKVWKA
jgi:UDP-N-acetyl-D-glucosamine dehydrogenase